MYGDGHTECGWAQRGHGHQSFLDVIAGWRGGDCRKVPRNGASRGVPYDAPSAWSVSRRLHANGG
jgi:hypothetical protein